MQSWKNKLNSNFKDRWNNLIKKGKNEQAYQLFLYHFPKFKHIEPKQRVKFYHTALIKLGLVQK